MPKLIKIQAISAGELNAYGLATVDKQQITYLGRDNSGPVRGTISGSILYLLADGSPRYVSASVQSFDASGFTLRWEVSIFGGPPNAFSYECYR